MILALMTGLANVKHNVTLLHYLPDVLTLTKYKKKECNSVQRHDNTSYTWGSY